MSPIPGVRNATGRRKAVFHLFPLFYSTRVACVGYVPLGVAVWARHPCCLAPLKSESVGTRRWRGNHLLAVIYVLDGSHLDIEFLHSGGRMRSMWIATHTPEVINRRSTVAHARAGPKHMAEFYVKDEGL